jgi:outer membrane receptor for ferric coprogen and ferric-rhodotorulic acid
LATRLSLADSLKLILGTRVSDYRYETSAGKATLKENGVVSPYAGLIYDLNDWSSVYLSYSDIFNPQSYKDASGNTLKPVVGSNYEAGIKGEFYEGRLNTAIAVFRLEQENLGKQDTYDLDACDGWCYIAAGLVISQGVDLSVNGEVLPGWQVSAGYTYVESKYGKGTQTGDPYASYLPEQILRASTSYALPGTDWTVGGDVRVQSEVYSEGTTGGTAYKVDQGGLALVGLMAKYRITDKADIGLRVANLFDRTYYERIGYPAYANFYGEPRNFNVTFRQAF